MSILELYLLFVIVPNVGCAATMIFVFSLVGLVVIGFIAFLEASVGDLHPHLRKALSTACIFSFLSGAVAIACPTQGDLVKIYGLNVLTNTAGAEKLPEDIVKYLGTIINTEVEEK